MNVNRDTAAGLGGSCLFDRVIWSWCFLGIVASLDVLEFGFAEDDVLLVDGGSFTVWKVGTKTVVMTIFCWGILKKNMEKTRQTESWNRAVESMPQVMMTLRRTAKRARCHKNRQDMVATADWLQSGFQVLKLSISSFQFLVKLCQFHLLPVNHQWTQSSVHSLFDFPGGPEAYSLATGRARTKVWSFQDEKHHMTCASGASWFLCLIRFRSIQKIRSRIKI